MKVLSFISYPGELENKLKTTNGHVVSCFHSFSQIVSSLLMSVYKLG
jgi:hypothetical protein